MRVGHDKLSSRPPLFGQILLRQGKITAGQLDEAIQEQLRTRTYLGEVLVRRGLLSSEDILAALEVQDSYAADRETAPDEVT
jgi:hypothetical protein